MAKDVYQVITARIVEQLEAGTVPWHKPWKSGAHGWPKNLVSGKTYRGINVMLLSCTAFELPYWLTFKQAKALGGSVRRGEKSMPVVFWKWLEKENATTGEVERIPLLRYYNVFNAAQCEGIDGKIPEAADSAGSPFEPIAECERLVEAMPERPGIHHGTTGAFYRPSDDAVYMPDRERFDNAEAYYGTLFHELAHSTGHQSRLNRPGITGSHRFGSGEYSREELVAEMGAAFLCGHAGIENATIDNSAAYIASWLERLKNDRKLVVVAAAQAQKAADFILNVRWDD